MQQAGHYTAMPGLPGGISNTNHGVMFVGGELLQVHSAYGNSGGIISNDVSSGINVSNRNQLAPAQVPAVNEIPRPSGRSDRFV